MTSEARGAQAAALSLQSIARWVARLPCSNRVLRPRVVPPRPGRCAVCPVCSPDRRDGQSHVLALTRSCPRSRLVLDGFGVFMRSPSSCLAFETSDTAETLAHDEANDAGARPSR
jgi:hypothetical protein